MKFDFKKYAPHGLAILLFILIAFAYFPEVLEGQRIGGHDNANFRGMAREIIDYREETGKEALWTNSQFGGMPAYMISMRFNGNKLNLLHKGLQLGPRPVSFVFLYLIGFYVLLLALRINPWLSIAGAIAFAFSSYNFVIIAAGHNSKALAIAYMAPVLAGILLSFRGRWLAGLALTAIALSLQILAGHPQITYYTLMIVFIFGLVQLIYAIREKKIMQLSYTVALLLVAVGLAVTSNSARLWTTLEYGKYSMRSPSELSAGEEDKTSGLDLSYATRWSYGLDETFSLLIPGFKGGSSDGSLSENSETYKLFARSNPAQAEQVIQHLPLYWGQQTSTVGNVYVGAIVIFLFIMGLFLVEPRLRWWLLSVSVLGILLAWGKHFMFLTEFFMNYIPGYNKFRTVSMILVLPGIAMPLMAILALNKVLSGQVEASKLLRALKWSLGIAGGLSLLFALAPDLAGSFMSASDANYQPELAEALKADRRSLLRTDALRSLVFIVLSAGIIYLYHLKKIKVTLAISLTGVLFLLDMWPVNKRYLDEKDFSPRRQAEAPFTAQPANQFIMNQPGHNNRVLNLTVSMFQDASTSFFHPSLGGYHGAKMRRYQDMIEHGMMNDIDALYRSLQSQSLPVVDSALSKTNVLNMLNGRFIILSPETQPITNRHAMGNAWFVQHLREVENADEEMAAVQTLDLDTEATIDRRYAAKLEGRSFTADPNARIELTEYQPNRMVYSSRSNTEQLAVFSEVYYPEGWQAYIDGEAVDHYQVNYLLRAMVLPPGSHEIVFEFRPRSFFTGSSISMVSSILLILLLLGAAWMEYSGKKILSDRPSMLSGL